MISLRDYSQSDNDVLLRIYEAERADLKWITGLNADAANELLQQQYLAEKKELERQYPSAALRLIVLDGKPIGRFDTYESENFIRILSISLLPEYRNRGIGSGLILDTVGKAKRTNRYVCLNVMWFNGRARSLYERLGFHVVSDTGVCCEMYWKPEEG